MVNYDNILSSKQIKTSEDKSINLLANGLMKIYQNNKDFIFNNWISLVKHNVKIQDKLEFEDLIQLFKNILNNYINYLKSKNIKLFSHYNIKIGEQMAHKNISYRNFMKAIPYFQECYIDIIVKNVATEYSVKCIILSNRIYNKALEDIRDEYFNIKDSTLTAIIKLSELRDDVTGKHVERAKDYAVLLSKELGMDDNFINDMNKASLLHDVGKIGIRDEVLLKPGKLTEDEFEEMKKHTIMGARTICKVISVNDLENGYLFMAIDIALYHHEKYDGSGYPYGLSGEQIPLSAKIFQIADAYDVITSKRPYKEPLSHEEAVRRIVSDSNKHFDPDIVNVFVKIQDKFKKVCDKYKNL